MLIQETLRKSFVSRELSTKLRFNVFSSVSHIFCQTTDVFTPLFYSGGPGSFTNQRASLHWPMGTNMYHVIAKSTWDLRETSNWADSTLSPSCDFRRNCSLETLLQATWQSGMVWGGRRFQGLFFKLIIIEIVRRFSGDPSFKLHGWFSRKPSCTSASEPQLTEVSTLFIL